MSIQYHEVFCENSKTQYEEYDICDLYLVGEGRDLVANSVRVEGTFSAFSQGTRLTNQDVKFNPNVGIHGVCENISVEFENMGIVQRLQEYPRLVNMRCQTTKDRNDLLNSKDLTELRNPDERYNQQICYGYAGTNNTNTFTQGVDFSFMPECCLNMMSGGNLPFDKTGYMKLSLTLARNIAFFYGRDVDTNTNYKITNLRVVYQTVPTENTSGVVMRSSVMIKNSIQSSFSNTSAKVPASCDAVSISFLQQLHENQFTTDNYALEEVPNINHIQYLFNDTSTFIRYKIDDKGDMLEKYLESMNSSGHNQVSANAWKDNKHFGLGVSFQGFVDLSQSKFNTQIASADNNINNRPIIMFSFFHSLIQM